MNRKKTVDQILEAIESVPTQKDIIPNARREKFVEEFSLRATRVVFAEAKRLASEMGYADTALQADVYDIVVKKAMRDIGMFLGDKYNIGIEKY